ncbi:uncharacterized protein [Palaemon carinicauda]|uniref:uncharacterized protein n=1 Tax=Palaemon carinicauda TaxID=392227 RepID=UPI0035B659FA
MPCGLTVPQKKLRRGATPYALVYGAEAVLPIEVKIPSLRTAVEHGLEEEENTRVRLAELESLDEKRKEALQQMELYKARIAQAYNRKVKNRVFQKGDLVLALKRPIIITRRSTGKFIPKWEGPFVIHRVLDSGAYILISEDGSKTSGLVNAIISKNSIHKEKQPPSPQGHTRINCMALKLPLFKVA